MKIQTLQESLNKALIIASRFTSPRAQLPVLGNILLSAQKTKFLISSTNLETSVSIYIGAQIKEEGDITIPAKIITELTSNLPAGAVNIESEKEQIKISSQNFSSVISGMNASDFPPIPQKSDSREGINLNKEKFIEALSQVLFAASIDETRPVLTGVLLIIKNNELILVATDGFRLSQKKMPTKGTQNTFKTILPRAALGELIHIMEDEEISLSFKEKDKQAVFATPDIILASRVLEGEFPDFEKIIPKTSVLEIFLDKLEFERAVKLASVFARESANIVKINIEKGEIEISAESPNSGSQKSRLDAKTEGSLPSGGFEIAFNYRFLEELIHAVKGEEIKIEFSTSDAPGVFTDPKDPNFLHLIMPVRIQS
jgi:DNA polymerase-3 subunit beta